MGLTEAMDHEAVGLVANQVSAVANRINGRSLGIGVNPASESHENSVRCPYCSCAMQQRQPVLRRIAFRRSETESGNGVPFH